jgi:hypothetical protein
VSKPVVKGAVVGAVVASVVTLSATAVAGGVAKSFLLGRTNTASHQSTLSGAVKAGNLRIVNKAKGPALRLAVPKGSAPLVVSPGAGKAANLNADKLDGLDASAFAGKAYSTGFDDGSPVTLEAGGSVHELMSVAVPTGAYAVFARLQGITGNDGGGNSFRYDCTLAGSQAVIDDPVYRVGETNGQENYLTYQGLYTGAGPLTLDCRSANNHTLTALSGSLVAISVGQ